MPQLGQVAVNTFVGGLLTEAGELTFPENASVDELNCDLLKDGSRRRRLGLSIESGSVLSTEVVSSNSIVTTHLWQNVGEQAGVEFVVVQLGAQLFFYEQGSGEALSANRVDTTLVSGVEYSLDMTAYDRPAGNGASAAEIQVASLKGALIVSSPEISTFYITRNVTTGAFTERQITFNSRDYTWQGNVSSYDTALATGSTPTSRKYDTKNGGWSDGPGGVGNAALTTYIGGGNYPPLTHSWYAGKNASGDFSVAEWERIYAGGTRITNGHYILNVYSKNRHSAAGFSGTSLNTEEDSRFSTVAGYASRVFYSGMANSTDDNGSKIYFSQLLADGFDRIGDCYQQNDPTSEVLSDLLDTDGGYISIPEAYNIKKLHTFGPNLYVFAENGVWKIGGVDDVFRASDYTVSKMTEDGLTAVGSFVSAQGRPFWWSNSGIFTVQPDAIGQFSAVSISQQTIQSFWDNISAAKRDQVRGIYDASTRRVFWLYPSATETSEVKKNEIILFDETLSAFIPWRISDQDTATDYVVDATFNSGVGASDTIFNVIDTSGNQVVDSIGDEVVVTRTGRALASSKIKLLVVDGTTGSITFAEFTDTGFTDWGDADYSSYAETAHSFLGDLEMRKSVPYITTFLKTTETGWMLNDAGDGYDPIRDSGCLIKAYWNFNTEPVARSQQLYRRKSVPVVDTGDLATFDYPTTVIVSRVKVRGRGRNMRLRFESEVGKDFHLLGYNIIAASNGRF
jgi:hypothetical protein